MPLINVKTAFYLNEILFNLSINTKVLFMAFSKTLNNKDIHLPTIAVTFNVKALRDHIKVKRRDVQVPGFLLSGSVSNTAIRTEQSATAASSTSL